MCVQTSPAYFTFKTQDYTPIYKSTLHVKFNSDKNVKFRLDIII